MSQLAVATILVVVGLVAAAGVLAIRRLRPGVEDIDPGPASAALSYVAAAFGILIGFMIVFLLGEVTEARHATGEEATAIGTAFDEAQLFPESEAGQPTGAVVLCHGFGAGGDDLVPLHAELVELQPALARQRFIFPEAPLSLGPGSRAWWMIDFEAIERLQAGDPAALREFRK